MAVIFHSQANYRVAKAGTFHLKNRHFKKAIAVITKNGVKLSAVTLANGAETTVNVSIDDTIYWSLTEDGLLDTYSTGRFDDWVHGDIPGTPFCPLNNNFFDTEAVDIGVDNCSEYIGFNVAADIVSRLGATRVKFDGNLLGCQSGSLSFIDLPNESELWMANTPFFRIGFGSGPLTNVCVGWQLDAYGSYYRSIRTDTTVNVLWIDTTGVTSIINSFSNMVRGGDIVFAETPNNEDNFSFTELTTIDNVSGAGSFNNCFTLRARVTFLNPKAIRFGKIRSIGNTNSLVNFISCPYVKLPSNMFTLDFRSIDTMAPHASGWICIASSSFEYVAPDQDSMVYDCMVLYTSSVTIGYSDTTRQLEPGQVWRIRRINLEPVEYTIPIEHSLSVTIWDGRNMKTEKGTHIIPITSAIIKSSMSDSTFSFIVDKHLWRQIRKYHRVRLYDIFKFSASEQGFVWTGITTSTSKSDITISGISLLDRVLQLPITYWDWITEPVPSEVVPKELQWWPEDVDTEDEKPKSLGPFIDAVVKYTYITPLARSPMQFGPDFDPDHDDDETIYDIHIGSNDFPEQRIYPIQVAYSADVGEKLIEQTVENNPCDGSGNWLTSLCDLYGLRYTFSWIYVDGAPTIVVVIMEKPNEPFIITDTTNGVLSIDQSIDVSEWETAQFYRLTWNGGFDEENEDDATTTRHEVIYEIDRYAYDATLVEPRDSKGVPRQNGSITGTLRRTNVHHITVDSNAKQFDPDWIVKTTQAARATGGDAGANNDIAITFNSEVFYGLQRQLSIGAIVDVQSNELEDIQFSDDENSKLTSLCRVVSRTITHGSSTVYSVELTPFDPFDAFFPANKIATYAQLLNTANPKIGQTFFVVEYQTLYIYSTSGWVVLT